MKKGNKTIINLENFLLIVGIISCLINGVSFIFYPDTQIKIIGVLLLFAGVLMMKEYSRVNKKK